MRTLLAASLLAAATCVAAATPLKLEYCITADGPGGTNQYHFTLTLDNHDGTWFDGQRFNWIIFGDVIYPGPTNFPDFVGDLPAPAPFNDEGWSSSGGGHNGPTLLDFGTNYDFHGWVPTAIGESLEWSGHSSIHLGRGEMKWSNINGTGVFADFETAILLDSCGEPYCPADYNQDGGVDGQDVEAFFLDWQDGLSAADTNQDGGVDGQDVETFFRAWEVGGC